jgi:glycosyltransferase involved in cell wall biosynthesis
LRILINTAIQRFGGAIQVAYSFIHECRKFPENEYIVWLGPGLSNLVQTADFPSNFTFRTFDFGEVSLIKLNRIQKTLSKNEMLDNPDVIISTSGPTYFRSNAPQIIGFNLPLYIYPESPYFRLLNPYGKLRLWLKKKIHFYFFKRSAVAYVTQTDDVNQRVRKALKTEKVFTVTNTHNAYYLNPGKYPPKLPKKKVSVFRLVTISSYYRHKDLEIMARVQQQLEKKGIYNVEFILTLKDEDFKRVNPQFHPRIINAGPVPPPECPSLYQECDGMFLPTLAECFSASYPEAMIMKKPIITTDLGL